jgi:hypothetical protein
MEKLEQQLASICGDYNQAAEDMSAQDKSDVLDAPYGSLRERVECQAESIGSSAVFVCPEIPTKKLQGALASYGNSVQAQDVLILVDDTLFGSAKEGLLITSEQILAKPHLGKPIAKAWSEIRNIGVTKGTVTVNEEVFINLTTVREAALAPCFALLNLHFWNKNDVQSAPRQDHVDGASKSLTIADEASSPSSSDKILTAISNVIDRNKASVAQSLKSKGADLSIRVLQDEAHMRIVAETCYKLLPTAVRFVISEATFIEYALSHRDPILKKLLSSEEGPEVRNA